MPSVCTPPGKKWSGEQQQISWAYSQKVVSTNEIVTLATYYVSLHLQL